MTWTPELKQEMQTERKMLADLFRSLHRRSASKARVIWKFWRLGNAAA